VPQGVDPDDPLFQFFKRFGPQFQGPQNAQPQLVRGLGSGFIVSQDGLILTNAHVVDNATEVTVKLTDRREFKAKVLGSDPQTDIAVIRIDAKNLPTVRLGDPSKTRVGEPVLAMGPRTASRTRSPPASSVPNRARCPMTPTCRSSRPTLR
jgi:serine protease Do